VTELGGLQPWHWIIVIAVFVLLFGAKKLPDAARSLGKSMRIFRSEIKEMQSDSKPEAAAPLPDVAGRAAPPATPIASERVDTPAPAPGFDVAGQPAPGFDVAGQPAPVAEPSDKHPA
jgi:sec-independent protein translocase protein TatA